MSEYTTTSWTTCAETRFFARGCLGEVRRVYHLEGADELNDCWTIAELADRLLAGMPLNGVVWEKPGTGASRPLWLLHGNYKGGGLHCRELGDYLESSQPFYAVAPRGADGGFGWTIEEMAEDRIDLVLDRQPEGPTVWQGTARAVSLRTKWPCG